MTVAPIGDEDWPEAIGFLKNGPLGSLNVYRTMARHPPLLAAWAALRDHLVVRSALTPRQSETVILRTGWHWQSRYEWMHHVSRGRRVGLSDRTIERCAAATWSPADDDEAMLIRAVDVLMAEGRLDTDQKQSLEAIVGVPGVLDLFATIGMYTTLAFLIETYEVPLDDDISAELRDDPLARLAPQPER